MKKLLILALMVFLLVLSACGDDTGNVYSHLQGQDVIVGNDNSTQDINETSHEGGVFEHLQENLAPKPQNESENQTTS